MAIRTKDTDGRRCIILTDVVDIAQASELKQALTEAIGSASRVSIQVSEATAIDVTTAQLLWAAVSCSSAAGTELVVDGPWSTQVEESFLNSGLLAILHAMAENSTQERSNVNSGR
jgi:anti-anti-sigma regulatory factor